MFFPEAGKLKAAVPPETGNPFFIFFSLWVPRVPPGQLFTLRFSQRRSNYAYLEFESVFSKVYRKSIPPQGGESHFRKKVFRAAPGNPRDDFSIFAWPKAVKFGLAGPCKKKFVTYTGNRAPPGGGNHNSAKLVFARGPKTPRQILSSIDWPKPAQTYRFKLLEVLRP